MPFFHSEDAALEDYNGKRVTILDQWQEACEDFVSDVVEVLFADGTTFTCWPSEVVDTEPEEYWCSDCNRYVAIANLLDYHGHGRDFTKNA